MIYVPQSPTAQFCWGGFAAIQQLTVLTDEHGRRLLEACVPAESTRLELIKVFLRYTDDHPEQARFPFAQVAVMALGRAYPCPSN